MGVPNAHKRCHEQTGLKSPVPKRGIEGVTLIGMVVIVSSGGAEALAAGTIGIKATTPPAI